MVGYRILLSKLIVEKVPSYLSTTFILANTPMSLPSFLTDSVGLDLIAAPDSNESEFPEIIWNLARSAPIDSVLVIGSLACERSSEVLVEGLKENPCKPRLYGLKEVSADLINEIKRSSGITQFGAVLIDETEFKLDEVYGAQFILLRCIQTHKRQATHHRLLRDPQYELISYNPKLRESYSVFRKRSRTVLDALPADSPVIFFTMLLDDEPFIRHHINVMKQLSCRWHWHVVDGSLMPNGTSTYLDELVQQFQGQVTVHRKAQGCFWNGKIEMALEPIKHIFEDGVLWQINADELWTVEQIEEGRRMFLRSPERTAAYFWCHSFVGEKLVVTARIGQGELRAWSFRPGMRWLDQEIPVLAERLANDSWRDVVQGFVFDAMNTEGLGLTFQRFAFVIENQVAIKQRNHAMEGVVDAWKQLQGEHLLPSPLRDYFPWIEDYRLVHDLESRNITPIARLDSESARWSFTDHAPLSGKPSLTKPVIVVDGVFFQLSNTGIARMWEEVLREWGTTEIGRRVWVLNRGGTAPIISGIRYYDVNRFDPFMTADDSILLQKACDFLCADVFISTYYTIPLTTPSVAMVYDMTPELLRVQDDDWQWREKAFSLAHSIYWVCISHSTASDLLRLQPEIPSEKVRVTQLAASPKLTQPDEASVEDFRERYSLQEPYLLIVGERVGLRIGNQGYKNASLAFKAWSLLPIYLRESLTIVCAGGKSELEDDLHVLAPEALVRILRFSDEDLRFAYAGAVVLVYPSLYEGFGLPVIEAMACGCPVITCNRSSLTEVAGDAAIFVDPWNANQVAEFIELLVLDPHQRTQYIAKGLSQAQRFSFPKMARQLAEVLEDAARKINRERSTNKESKHGRLRLIQSEMDGLRSKLNSQTIRLHEAKSSIQLLKDKLKKTQEVKAHETGKRRRPAKKRYIQNLWDHIRGKL